MSKSINMEYLLQLHRETGVDIYTLVKRELSYRRARQFCAKTCERCRYFAEVVYDGETRMQCHWVGVIGERTADIEKDYTCRMYKAR